MHFQLTLCLPGVMAGVGLIALARQSLHQMHSWQILGFDLGLSTHTFSDHSSVFFQLERGDFTVASPFKFNPVVLCEASFGDLVKKEWNLVQGSGVIGAQRRLAQKLQNIKVSLKSWLAEKKRAENQTLNSLEEQINTLTKNSWEVDFSSEAGSQLKALEVNEISYYWRKRLVGG
jgi:hypothetical protein